MLRTENVVRTAIMPGRAGSQVWTSWPDSSGTWMKTPLKVVVSLLLLLLLLLLLQLWYPRPRPRPPPPPQRNI